jgi:tRNA (guanine-N7-)-methyltransferase
MDSTAFGDRTGAFFGRRKAHRLRAGQAALLDTLLPRLALDLSIPAPADLRALFPAPVDQVHLEVGFGGGEHLIARARDNPRSGFIGIEPFVNGMAKALVQIDANRLVNVRLHQGDATDMIAWLPTASLSCIELIYPDPWPKRRHQKRRFVQDRTIAALARILRPGGEFRFVTDVEDYAAWTLRRFTRSPAFLWLADRADDWRKPWGGFSGTRYEAKALRAGRVPTYLTFRRQPV